MLLQRSQPRWAQTTNSLIVGHGTSVNDFAFTYVGALTQCHTMLFSKHLQERAAKKLLAGKRCRALLVWTLTFMMALSASIVPLLGALTSPWVFGCGLFLLYAPAAFRAKSLFKPILYPATVILPAGESLLGLDPKCRPAKCFYTFTLVVRVTAVAGIGMVYHHIGSLGVSNGNLNYASWVHEYQWEKLRTCCDEFYGPTYIEDCLTSANCSYDCYSPPSLPDPSERMMDADGCIASEAACLQKAPTTSTASPFTAPHFCWTNSTSTPDWTVVCARLSQVPQYLECSLQGLSGSILANAVYWYFSCREEPPWMFANMCPLILYGNSMNQRHGSTVLLEGYTFGILCAILISPFIAAILLVLILCCFPAVPDDVELRLAVDAEARRMEEELNEAGTAPLSMLGRGLLRLDLMLMFVDFAGDIFSVFTFVAKGHVWFGVCLALIILRSVVDIVKLQWETGLLKEVQMSLRANTLTNSLCDLLRAEKTVEGTLTSVLLVYGMLHNFDSPLFFAVTIGKYALSVFSVTQGCLVVFHLAPGESERASLVSAVPLGRRALDAE